MRNLVNQLIKKIFLIIAFVLVASIIVCASKSNAVTLKDIEFNAMREYVLNENVKNAESRVFAAVDLQGAGTEESPYLIGTADDLNEVRNDLTAYYRLTVDIDLNLSEFEVIGSSSNKFTGTFDGNGYSINKINIVGASNIRDYLGLFAYNEGTIKNLKINTVLVSGHDYIGAVTGFNNGTIENVEVINCIVYGNNYVGGVSGQSHITVKNTYSTGEVNGYNNIGGLIGYVRGTVEQCYSTASVEGVEDNIGGLIGYLDATIKNCYSTGIIDGRNAVGGLIGYAYNGSITNCYSIGKNIATGSNVGGLIGYNRVTVTNSYWAPETTGKQWSASGTQNNIQNMSTIDGYTNWDFSQVWDINPETSLAFLRNMQKPEEIMLENIESKIEFTSGYGTRRSPYIVTTKEQLSAIRNNPKLYYRLGNDINLEDINWEPIGNSTYKFTGDFDGANYTIQNLTINSETEDYKGLFGYSEGTLKNIKFENVNVAGRNYVGALAGYNTGNVENVEILSGTVEGKEKVGSLIGHQANEYATISNCYSVINVAGTNQVGGLVGYVNGTTVKLCYTTGNITGTNYVGGLIGYIENGTVEQCYSISNVEGIEDYIGGLVGYTYRAILRNNYSTGTINGRNNVGGLIGGDAYYSNIVNCYTISKNMSIGNNVGGLVGYNNGNELTSSYWSSELTGKETSGRGIKRLVVDMAHKANYENWDFNYIWIIEENTTMPYLKDLPKPASVKADNLEGVVYFNGGDGTEWDPYLISTPAQLNAVRNSLDKYYKLSNNIDLSGYDNWEPIGNSTYKFTGSLDGAEYTISNLTINRETENDIGLFGYSEGTLKNIKFENVTIKGKNSVGVLAGYDRGNVENVKILSGTVEGAERVGGLIGHYENGNSTISNCSSAAGVTGTNYVGGLVGNLSAKVILCYTTGNVEATGEYAGGLSGYNTGTIEKCYTIGNIEATGNFAGGLTGRAYSSEIRNSYSTASVTGKHHVGGIIGYQDWPGTINKTYATGKVSGNENTTDQNTIGGLIGSYNGSGITSSYWSSETTEQQRSGAGNRRSTENMAHKANYEEWDFDDVWTIEENKTTAYLKELPKPVSVKADGLEGVVYFEGGDGTERYPYLISTPAQLNAIRNTLTANYKLLNNIDLSGYDNWEPIGNSTYKFTGSLDGAEYTISNLTINRETENDIGLFGYSEGTLKNIKFENVTIKGKNSVGALAGYDRGNVENVEVLSGTVEGTERVGGLIGHHENGNSTISNCSSAAGVTGTNYVGGLVGRLSAIVKVCYTTGNVQATGEYAGGLFGYNSSGIIEKCYTTGNIEATGDFAGGLTGRTYAGEVRNSYSTASVTGKHHVGGIIGYQDWPGTINKTYATGKVSGNENTTDQNTIGGLIGSYNGSGITSSYWSSETTEQQRSGAGNRRSTENMAHKSNYEEWDFNDVWTIEENKTTAYLQELPKPESVKANGLEGIVYFEGGDGTEENPYLISTPAQLSAVRNTLTANYKLLNNIDLSGYDNWEPIGTSTYKFTGSLDGDGHSIKYLTINRETENDIGLFGYSEGTLKNIKFENVAIKGKNSVGVLAGYDRGNVENVEVLSGTVEGTERVGGLIGHHENGNSTISNCSSVIGVTGTNYVGGLVGNLSANVKMCYTTGNVVATGGNVGGLSGCYNSGTMEKCYTTGSIEATEDYAGGLTGSATSTEIRNSYSTASVKGRHYVGGMIGYQNWPGSINRVYVIGRVSGNENTTNQSTIGGLIGYNNGSGILYTYYSPSLSGIDTTIDNPNTNGTAVSTGELQNRETFVDWDFEHVWSISNGNYPVFRTINLEGEGNESSPFIIKTAEQLFNIRNEMGYWYKLGNNIDLSGYESWTPIGDSTKAFNGGFDGNGYKITGLTITGNDSYVGLFGNSSGKLKNVVIEGANISGNERVGILAGNVSGTITDCIVDGVVNGKTHVGGLCGYSSGTTYITGCHASGTINGKNNVGGLCGYVWGNSSVFKQSSADVTVVGEEDSVGGLVGWCDILTIKDVYTVGNVTGRSYVSGIIGNFNRSDMSNAYTVAHITGQSYVGAVNGNNYASSVSNCIYNSELTGLTNQTSATQKTVKQLLHESSYENWDFEKVWHINEGTTFAYLNSNVIPDGIKETNLEYNEIYEGEGTQASPYIITNAEEMNAVRNNLSAHYKLGNNIDLSSIEEWAPIGNTTYPFTGSLDGQEYSITGLTIATRESNEYNGLFGYSKGDLKNIVLDGFNITAGNYTGALVGYTTGKIDNVTVQNSNITGKERTGGIVGHKTNDLKNSVSKATVIGTSYTGGLVGYASGATELNYSTGTVTSTGDRVGGLVGHIEGTIEKCYSTANVTGNESVGGLIGYTHDINVTNCFATGSVQGNNNVGSFVGYTNYKNLTNVYGIGKVTGSNGRGLVGANYNSTATNSYWTPETTEKLTSALGTANSIENMKHESGYTSWDFWKTWTIEEGTTLAYLQELPKPNEVIVSNVDLAIEYENGNGTKENPYIITNVEQLKGIIYDLNAYYELGNDIDLTDVDWTPIGNTTYNFKGTLDGKNKKISNLTIDGTADYVGLFGYNQGTIKNIKFDNINLKGASYVGAVAGYSTNIISGIELTNINIEGTGDYIGGVAGRNESDFEDINISNSTIKGKNYVGGIAGRVDGKATSCVADVTVEGNSYVGGLAGIKGSGLIGKSYTKGTVTSTGDNLGGLIGYTDGGTIEQCYSTASVTSTSNYVGGLVGQSRSNITNCFAVGNVNGRSSVGGLVGYVYSGNVKNSYSLGEITGTTTSYIGGLVGQGGNSDNNSYWCPELSKTESSSIGTRKGLNSLILKDTFANWNFYVIWKIDEGESTPYFKTMPKPEGITINEHQGVSVWQNGSGLKNDPYVITTVEQFKLITNELDSSYILGNDLDFANEVNWEGIGTSTNQFTGKLDGNGFKIKNLTITGEDSNRGLFNYNRGTITNIIIDNPNVTGNEYVGAVAGVNNGTIQAAEVKGGTVTGTKYVGAIAGGNSNRIEKCISNTTVTGTSVVGGLVGNVSSSNSVITGSYSDSNVTATGDYVGGLVGNAEGGLIEKCYSTGDVETQGKYVGGLVGYMRGTTQNCYSTSHTIGASEVGGLIGYNNGTITNSYAVGLVEGTGANIGGLSGVGGSANNSYWSMEKTNQPNSSTGEARTVAELMDKYKFSTWDFQDVWEIQNGATMPYLDSMKQAPGLGAGSYDTDVPDIATMTCVDNDTTSHSLTFGVQAQDQGSGVERIEIYIDNELADTIKFSIPQTTLITKQPTINGLLPNRDYACHIVVYDMAGLHTASEPFICRTLPITDATITVDNTELTNNDVNVTISANLTNSQVIEYRTDNSSWINYTQPFAVNKNQKIYARVFDGERGSDEASLVIDNIDKLAPDVKVENKGNKLELTIEDLGVAGLDGLEYDIEANNLTGTQTPTYGDEIKLTDQTNNICVYEIPLNVGYNHVYIKVTDNAGNILEKKLGVWYVPNGQFTIEIEKVSNMSDTIKLQGVELNIEGETETTDVNGKATFTLNQKMQGRYEYTLEESVAPQGYLIMPDIKFNIEFNMYGDIVDANSYNSNLQVVSTAKDKIELKLINQKADVANYDLIIRAVDKLNNSKVVKDTGINVNYVAASGETIPTKKLTNENGEINCGSVVGNGQIDITINEYQPGFGYFADTNTMQVCLNRDLETGVVTVIPDKNASDLKIKIDKNNKKIIILKECDQKPYDNQLSLKVSQIVYGTTSYLQGIEYRLIQPYGFGEIKDVTDTNGEITFNTIEPLGEGDYIYKLIPEDNSYNLNEIRFVVTYDEYKNIKNVREITSETTSITGTPIDKTNTVTNDYKLNVVKDLNQIQNAETMKLIVRAVDDNDNTKVLSGVSYRVTYTYKGVNQYAEGQTDMFGDFGVNVIKQDKTNLRIYETATIKGYTADATQKDVAIVKNNFTGKYEIDNNQTSQDIDVTYDETTNTILVITKCKTKVSNLVKGRIHFTLHKIDNKRDRTGLNGVTFNVTEITENTYDETVTTTGDGKQLAYGTAILPDFDVKQIGKYEFVIDETQTITGFQLFEEPVKVEVIYGLDEYENIMKVSAVNIIQGEQYVSGKTYKESEGEDVFHLNIDLELNNFEKIITDETDKKTDFKIIKKTGEDEVPLANTGFNIELLFNDGTSMNYQPFTTAEGIILKSYLLPQGQTIIRVQETQSAPGYELDSTQYEITVNREGNELTVIDSDIELAEASIEQIVMQLTNEVTPGNDTYTGNANNGNINDGSGSGSGEGEQNPFPDGGNSNMPFTVEVTNINAYNPNLLLEGSEVNVSINQESNWIYNNTHIYGRSDKNVVKFENIHYCGQMSIFVEQTKAPLHHLKNDYIYRFDINKLDEANLIEVENTIKDDNASISIDQENRIIKITIKNEPSDFMFAITTIDSQDIDRYLGGAGFKLSVENDSSAADLKINKYLQTDESGYASETIFVQAVGETSNFKLDNVKTLSGYELLKKVGIDITFDDDGNVTAVQVLKGTQYAENACTIVNRQNKYVEAKIMLNKEPNPTYKLKINLRNSEDDNERINATYNVRMLQAQGSKINTRVSANDEIDKLVGTGEITFEIRQIEIEYGYTIDPSVIKVVVNREITETALGKQSVITLDTEKSDNVDIEIDNDNNEIILNLVNNPEFGISIKNVDGSNDAIKLFDTEYTLTSTEGNNMKRVTDINGNAYFQLGEAVTNNTVTYTLTQTSASDGYKAVEPINIEVTFNGRGKITSARVSSNNAEMTRLTSSSSSLNLEIRNKRISVTDLENPDDPNGQTGENNGKKSTITFVLNKLNARNNGVKIPNTSFDIMATADSGEKIHAVGISDANGQIVIDNIRGTGIITLDITELESSYGYALDDRTRTITLNKTINADGIESLQIVADETSEDFYCSITSNANVWYVGAKLDNDIASDKIGITIEKHDRDEDGLLVPNAVFSIKDVSANETKTITTDKLGVATLIQKAKDSAGLYVYQIIEQDTLVGYKPAEGVAELRVTFNDNSEITSAVLYNVDETQYKISYQDSRYIKIDAYDERREMGLEKYDLVVAKVDKYNNNEPIPNSLLQVNVKHQYGIEVAKEEYTNNLGEVYLNNLNGHGNIDIDIQELMGENIYISNVRKARLVRDEITGHIELDQSTNIDIEIDNDNKVVKLILKNIEERDPSGFTVVKVDNQDDLMIIPGIEFQVMNETAHKGNPYITDENGRFNVGYVDNGNGALFTLTEIRTDSVGYNAIPEIRVRALFNDGITTLEVVEGEDYATVIDGDENTYPKLVIKNEQKELDIGSYRLEIIKADVNEKDIVLEGARIKTKVENEVGVLKLIKDAETDANGRIYFNKINGAGRIDIELQEFVAPDDYLTNFAVRKVSVNRDAQTGEMSLLGTDEIDESNVEINNDNKTITVYVPNELKDGRYNMVVQKLDEEGNLITQNTTKFAIANVGLINSNTTEDVLNSMDNAIEYETNLNSKAIVSVLRVPSQAGTVRYNIKETQAPNGYALDENIYHIDVEFARVNGLMQVVNVTSSDEDVVNVEEFNSKFIRLNFKDGEKVEDPLYLTSEIYTIDNSYCDRVSPDTTIKEFCSKVQTNGIKRVFDKNGNEIDISDESKLVGTSYKIRAERGEESIEREVVVVGDYNGDGIITISDVAAVNKYFLGAIPQSEIRDRICDITGEKAITISDVGKLNKFFLGAIPRLINY